MEPLGWGRFRYRFSHSVGLRRTLCLLYRVWNYREGQRILSSLSRCKGIPLVAMNFHKSHLVEHFKDLYWALKTHDIFRPLPVFPVSSPWGYSRKNRDLERFQERFGLEVGKTLLPYPWLSSIRPVAIIEGSVSPLRGMFRGIPKILAYHNLATMGFGKSMATVRRIGDYKYLFLTGPLQREAVVKAHRRYGGKLPEMVEVGYLRGDRLMARKETFDRKGYLASLGLEDLPTVMYAPTWGRFSSAVEWVDHLVAGCAALGFNLLIRLHPLMVWGKNPFETGGVEWQGKFRVILSRFPRVRVLMDDDIDPALLASQVLVTDVSSVGMDFMLLGKPVVFLPAPGFFEIFGDGFPIARVRGDREVKSKGELMARLKESMGERGGVPLEEMVYNPGRALETMVDFLEAAFL